MTAILLDGKALAEKIRAEIAAEVGQFTCRTGGQAVPCGGPGGRGCASQVYVRNKQKACEQNGLIGRLHRLGPEATTTELLDLIDRLNRDPVVHGILAELPLPKGIDPSRVLDTVFPRKDVDAFHPENVGRIVQGRPLFLPCTPHGIQQTLAASDSHGRGGSRRIRPQRDRRQADRPDALAKKGRPPTPR